MGNPKQKWTAAEEDALRAGVAKHGPGKWKLIQRDPEFNPLLYSRSNIDLKDKWRNLSGNGSGQVARDKLRIAKPKVPTDVLAITFPVTQTPPVPAPHDAAEDAATDDDHPKRSTDAKSPPKYNAMIFEAFSTLNDPNGLDIGAIVKFIEDRHETPPNFRRLLGSRLRRLFKQGKLDKAQNQNRYKLKDAPLVTKAAPLATKAVPPATKAAPLAIKLPPPKKKEISHQPSVSTAQAPSSESLEEATVAAAYWTAEAENKSFVASGATKEAEKVLRMAEDAESMHNLVKEMFETCLRGEIVSTA